MQRVSDRIRFALSASLQRCWGLCSKRTIAYLVGLCWVVLRTLGGLVPGGGKEKTCPRRLDAVLFYACNGGHSCTLNLSIPCHSIVRPAHDVSIPVRLLSGIYVEYLLRRSINSGDRRSFARDRRVLVRRVYPSRCCIMYKLPGLINTTTLHNTAQYNNTTLHDTAQGRDNTTKMVPSGEQQGNDCRAL